MIGIVADDITGANDIGAMFSAAGFDTRVRTAGGGEGSAETRPDVLIIDTDSRYLAPDDAYRAVASATEALRAAGCDRFIKKTCSVFRGNVGAEFDAMLDTLGSDTGRRMIVVPGYPTNNRRTVHGVLYVGDLRLEDSHFRHDPVHPTTSSDVVEILRAQTVRPVHHVDTEVVARGPRALRSALDALADRAGYRLIDVEDRATLITVALATRDQRVFGGSAGLASELAPLWRPNGAPPPSPPIAPAPGIGIPVVAGSLSPITAEQLARLEDAGAARVTLDTAPLFDPLRRSEEIDRIARRMADHMAAGRDVALRTPAPEHRAAGNHGLNEREAGRIISNALGEAVASALRAVGGNRLLAAGGDTSSAVCAGLGATELHIGPPIEPGLPICTGLSEPPVRLILKGGSMGTPDFVVKALAALRAS